MIKPQLVRVSLYILYSITTLSLITALFLSTASGQEDTLTTTAASASCDEAFFPPAAFRSYTYLTGSNVRSTSGTFGAQMETYFRINMIAYFDPDISSSYHKLAGYDMGTCSTGYQYFSTNGKVAGVALATPEFCIFSGFVDESDADGKLRYSSSGATTTYMATEIIGVP